MKFVKKNVLVTGSTGFIGRNLVLSLLEGSSRVTGISLEKNLFRERNHYTHRREPIVSGISLEHYDLIFHLAGTGYGNDSLDESFIMKTNLDCTINLLEGIPDPQRTVFVFASSCSIYGNNSNIADEELNPEPNSFYGKSKYSAEEYIKKFSEDNGMKIVIARIFNVYGLEDKNSIIFKIINSIKKDKKMPLNPNLVRDFIHVDDVIYGLQFLSKNGSGVYNLGSGVGASLENVCLSVEKVIGKHLLKEPFLTYTTNKSVAKIDKIKQLGWNPRVNLEQGIKEMVMRVD